MAEERVQRRLAAILAADIVGYSRMMEADEEGTLVRVKALRNDLIDPKISEYGGRVFKTTGDGLLVEFQSAVDAVRSAVDVQRAIARFYEGEPKDRKILFRIGVSLGDVMVDGDDLFGNGVNVAARMESLAEPGAICVSGNIHEHVVNALDVTFEELGEQAVRTLISRCDPIACILNLAMLQRPSRRIRIPQHRSRTGLPSRCCRSRTCRENRSKNILPMA